MPTIILNVSEKAGCMQNPQWSNFLHDAFIAMGSYRVGCMFLAAFTTQHEAPHGGGQY